MKKLLGYFAVLALLFTGCKKQEEIAPAELALGDFVLNTEHISPGQTVDMTYNGTDTEVKAHYYYMVNNRSFPVDINIDETNIASITIPDSAQAVVFNFKIDGKFDDNNKKGYLMPLHNEEGTSLAGSKAALANYVMTYGDQYGITVDKDQLFNDIKDDITNNPELKDAWNSSYLNMAYRQDKANGEQLINDYISSVTNKADITEDDYSSVIRLYNTMGKREVSDSLIKVASTKFPNGETAKNSYGSKFYEEKDLAKKEALLKEYTGKYSDLGNTGNFMVRSLAMAHYDNGDLDKFNSYSKMIADNSAKAGLFNSVAWPLAEKGENLEFAAEASKSSLDLMKAAQTSLDNKPDYYTESQYKTSLKNSYNVYADTYALILFKQGNIKDAITYQEKAIGEGTNGEMNERYVEFLMADKQFNIAQEKAEAFIREGHSSTKIKEYYKEAFLSSNDDITAFNTKLKALEDIAHKEYVEEIKATMIEEEAPSFTLKNTNGEEVSLASLKGKTVILDFWATWCGPCKASFPGMQQVVTKYKDDENVVLLFVDTFESGDNREKLVTDFIKDNNYDFHVVYDNAVENSRDFEVAEKYGISGIPTKVIIDKNGNIRFKAVGYSGQTEKLVSEMDIMIEVLKS